MPTRRRLLKQAVTLALSEPLIGTVAGSADASSPNSDTRISRGKTQVVVQGTPQVLGLAGVPSTVASQVAAANRRYQSLSLAAIDRVSATVWAEGREIQTGFGTAYGSFDPDATAGELDTKTNFRRVGAESGQGSRSAPNSVAVDRFTAQHASDSDAALLIRDDPPAALVVGGQRVDIAHGLSPDDSTTHLLTARDQSRTSVPKGASDSDLAAVLGGDVVAHMTVDEQTRGALRTELPDSATALDALVQGTQEAGIGAAVGPETTTLRYVLRIDDDQRHAVDSLLDDLTAEESVEELGQSAWSDGFVAEVSVQTATLWSVHEQLRTV